MSIRLAHERAIAHKHAERLLRTRGGSRKDGPLLAERRDGAGRRQTDRDLTELIAECQRRGIKL